MLSRNYDDDDDINMTASFSLLVFLRLRLYNMQLAQVKARIKSIGQIANRNANVTVAAMAKS